MTGLGGRMDRATALALASLGVLVLLVVSLLPPAPDVLPGDGSSSRRLFLYCAAGIKPPVEAAAREYERRYGVAVDIQYGGSGTLLSNLSVTRNGDLFLPADETYLELARERDKLAETFPLASMRPVLGVPAGNPLKIESMEDLLTGEIAIGIANPDTAACGRIARKLLGAAGLWDVLMERVEVAKPTVTDLANDLKLGALDCAILWDATAGQYPEIDAVHVPVLDTDPRLVTLGVLKSSAEPREALRFARFLAARDEGLQSFENFGYVVADGDVWAREPELVLMSGAMLNRAIDDTITEFEDREAVRVNRIYNGCGILVAQMRTGNFPDAYFSCDASFLDLVEQEFEPGLVVSSNRMVILVQRGNPRGISDLIDLADEGCRVGLGHPTNSALGALTRELLESDGTASQLEASGNVLVESATGDFLVNQLRTGALDASIVYASNAAHCLDELEIVEIGNPARMATQPYAVGRNSDHKRTMERLLESIRSASSRARFEALGFGWAPDSEG
jgi:molybdenum ABC transporter molybdate-binding protein